MALTTIEINMAKNLGFDVSSIKTRQNRQALRDFLLFKEFEQTDVYKKAKDIYDYNKQLFNHNKVVAIHFNGYPQPKIVVILSINIVYFPTNIDGLPIEIGKIVPY